MAESFQFVKTIPNVEPNQVFETAVKWLRAEGATIKRVQPPLFVEADHGSFAALPWGRRGRKTIALEIGGLPPQSQVRVKVSAASTNAPDVAMHRELARANWGLFLADLWARLGDADAVGEARLAFASVDWAKQRNKGIALAVIGLLAAGLYYLVEPAIAVPTALWAFSRLFLWIGFLGLVAYGVWTALSAVSNAAKSRPG